MRERSQNQEGVTKKRFHSGQDWLGRRKIFLKRRNQITSIEMTVARNARGETIATTETIGQNYCKLLDKTIATIGQGWEEKAEWRKEKGWREVFPILSLIGVVFFFDRFILDIKAWIKRKGKEDDETNKLQQQEKWTRQDSCRVKHRSRKLLSFLYFSFSIP